MNLIKIRVIYDGSLPENKTFFDELKEIIYSSSDYVSAFARASAKVQATLNIVSLIDFETFALNLMPGAYFSEGDGELIFSGIDTIPRRDKDGSYTFIDEYREMREQRSRILRIVYHESGEILWSQQKALLPQLTRYI